MTNATRYSMGLIDVMTERDARHRPIGHYPTVHSLYDIRYNLSRHIQNDTLALLRAGAPIYPSAKPSRIPNTDTIELLILIPTCLSAAFVLYCVLACYFTKRKTRPTLPTTVIAEPTDDLQQCEQEYLAMRRVVLRTTSHVHERLTSIAEDARTTAYRSLHGKV
ncbi:hypothetical protein MYAM1_003755 [Malassezia yamatoensis]|uniref:Uncharacterized protein n=1 Tax=Malassezia yamatoensis TaxID=253288 RepID=A0AAJ6CII1_9BASI|nr:hypothetical protein MYAM1_003755 [Malassezia yamatoensis]